MRLILASNSKNRKDLLDMIGLKYEIIKSRKEEESEATDPFVYVGELSKTKALDVLEQIDYDALIVACDTIIYMDGKIYEKPKTKEEAFEILDEIIRKKEIIKSFDLVELNPDYDIENKTEIIANKILENLILEIKKIND